MFALGAVIAIAIWLAGRRQGQHKESLRRRARAYVRELEHAQDAGAAIPELSPQLRSLLDDPPA